MKKTFSICTTNYNCAHALKHHLESVYSQMNEDMFEYIVVDNKSKDDSEKILREFEKEHDNMKVISQKCSMGRGREIAFEHSSYDLIMVIDTDTVYFPMFSDFIRIYLEKYRDVAVQAIYGGIFPRDIWIEIGGRRDLNIYEDLDMWIRIWKLGKMKWYPVFVGENLKEASSMGSYEYKSKRYSKFDKIKRFIRREYDILRTKEIHKIDLEEMYKNNIIDFGLGDMEETWVRNIPRMGPVRYSKVRGREFSRILKS
jgi:glycosyltransferase involved in cell wall biosynthesis